MTGDLLDEVGKTQIILVFKRTTVSMEVKIRMESTLQKANYTQRSFTI